MTSLHHEILDAYFWAYIDGGAIPENTPLFTGLFEGTDLSQSIADRLEISPEEAEAALEDARREVML